MIRLSHLEKYFNRGNDNEIHVINDTSLEFPEKGLVAITGPSGCGKTTLLNVIGGLDSFTSGEIDFDGETITSYKPGKVDDLRNRKIGYIFQNYNLIEDKTVYENIEVNLNMAGIYDQDDIEERINYVLESVGMYNYRKRNVMALSGGQQQRVAIARAIAKNPKVVLADEPTGNLDVNNTFEVMGIIKKISQSCLVILVSHEKDMVDFYADRVIELEDGVVVNQYENEGNRTLDHIDERNIYLKDLNKKSQDEPVSVEYYTEKEEEDKPSIRIVELRNMIYIKAEAKKKIQFLTGDAEIRLLDEHYQKPQTSDATESEFNLTQFSEPSARFSKTSFMRWRDTLKSGFGKIFRKKKLFGKIFLFAYFIISALIVFNLATYANIKNVDETEFLDVSRDLVAIEMPENFTFEESEDIIDTTPVTSFSPYKYAQSVNLSYQDFYQGRIFGMSTDIYPVPLSEIDPDTLIEGDLPDTNTEVAIDAWVADELLEQKALTDVGITTYEGLIGARLNANNRNIALTITGIIESEQPVAVLTDANHYFFASELSSNIYAHGSAIGHYTLVDGEDDPGVGEALVPDHFAFDVGDQVQLAGQTFEVAGTFELVEAAATYNVMEYVISNEDYETITRRRNIDEQQVTLYAYADDMEQAIETLNEDYQAYSAYEDNRATYVAQREAESASNIRLIVITMAGVVIYIFFMVRSSMLGRIKEIGVYRAIGATKKDIYKIFASEIIAFTTIGSMTGYLVMSLLIWRVQAIVGDLVSAFYFPLHYFLGGIAGIYLINLIFGLIPVFNLLRKTPAEIGSKYDI